MSKFLDENGLSRFWSNLKSRLVGKKTTGETYTYTVNGSSVEKTAGVGAEVFNYYDTSGENRNLAIGDYSHAEGLRNLASGPNSHVEGNLCIASGISSHAEGFGTTASGKYSHAEGSYTTASGINSHAEGHDTTASGNYSHAEGYSTTASSENQHVQGKYNIEDVNSKYAFIIGNGNASAPSNAFAVDWNGLIYQNNSATGVDLNNKVDKVDGKDLSTNDYTTVEKTKLAALENYDDSQIVADISALQASVSGKVDAISGMGLSQNSFTDAEKAKLAGIETGANKTTVDSALNNSSVNPVQNKAIFKALYDLGTPIESGTDLDSLMTPGNYYSPSSSVSGSLLNCPLPYIGFRLNVYYTSSVARIE